MSDQPTPTTPDLSALLTAATLPAVPEGVAKWLSEQLTYFAAKNTNRRTLVMTAELAPFILALVAVLFLITFVPTLVLALPRLAGYLG